MALKTLSSREFNQDVSKAKAAANEGPVIITDRGNPAHVLLTYADFKRLSGASAKITDLLAMPESVDCALDLPSAHDLARPADFS